MNDELKYDILEGYWENSCKKKFLGLSNQKLIAVNNFSIVPDVKERSVKRSRLKIGDTVSLYSPLIVLDAPTRGNCSNTPQS